MTFRKIEATKDETGLDWIVEDIPCRRVSDTFEIIGTTPQHGEYLVPFHIFPDVVYKVIDRSKKEGKIAVDVKSKGIIRDICLQLYDEGFYKGTEVTLLSIEKHYEK